MENLTFTSKPSLLQGFASSKASAAAALLGLLLMSPAATALQVTPLRVAECRANLEKRLCYSAAIEHWYDGGSDYKKSLASFQDRKCSPTPPDRKKTLLSVYDKLPKEVQAAFCAMRRIYLSYGKTTWGARTEYFFDESKTAFGETEWGAPEIKGVAAGFILEIGEASRFRGETSSAYVTRVTQARFGHDVSKGVSPDLPSADYIDSFGTDGALATTIIHEIGHMVHRAAEATRSSIYKPMAATSWSEASWIVEDESYSMKNPANDALWEKMRSRTLAPSDAASSISLLKSAGLSTFYSSSGPDEDFAESFMLYFFDDLKFKIQGKVAFDLRQENLENPLFAKKRSMMKALVDSPSLYSLSKSSNVTGHF